MLTKLHNKYNDQGLEILAFQVSQFLNQAPGTDAEFLNSLKYVRPGGGFVPPFEIFSMIEVNGAGRHPIWAAFFDQCPFSPSGYINPPGYPPTSWTPLAVSDVAWNFEKVLIGRDGKPSVRYDSGAMEADMEDEIIRLLAAK